MDRKTISLITTVGEMMVTKEEDATITVKQKRWFCDICGEERIMGCSKHICSICGCDVCDGCSREDDSSEYEHFCPKCWEIGVPYRKILDITREEYYTRVAAIEKTWRDEVMKVKNDG